MSDIDKTLQSAFKSDFAASAKAASDGARNISITLSGNGRYSRDDIMAILKEIDETHRKTGHFTGRLQLDFGDWGRDVGRIAVTLGSITWTRYGYTLPPGFMSDGASVPRALWWFLPPWGDRSTIAALFHDWLCELLIAGRPQPGATTRADCDRLFRDCLVDLGVSAWRAWAAWTGVRAFSIASGA